MVAGKVADDYGLSLIRPWQPERIGRKLVGMRNIKRRGKGRLFPDLIGTHNLGDLHDSRPIGLEIISGDRAVARAKVDTEAETLAHSRKMGRRALFQLYLRWGDAGQPRFVRLDDARELDGFSLPALVDQGPCEGRVPTNLSQESVFIRRVGGGDRDL
jgi:hypothetical protein